MSWFKCKHPLRALVVQKEQTEKQIDEDFIHVDYHLHCVNCGEYVKIIHARCVGGVDALYKRVMARHREGLKEVGNEIH